jgi:hypothetical protein
LEAATKQYGVPLLLSGDFAQELSAAAQRYLRLVDRVTVKGSREPIELYTFDVAFFPETLGEAPFNVTPRNAREAAAARLARDPPIRISFASDPAIASLQAGVPDGFFHAFEAGVQAYLAGNWPEARRCLRVVQTRFLPDDGPTATLLRAMDELGEGPGRVAPAAWRGYRELTEK